MGISDKIALGAAFIALGAFAFSIWSAVIAKKSLKIMQEQEKRQHSSLKLYLNDSFSLSVKDEYFTIYSFLITLSNLADIDTSIKRIELIINYKKGEQACNIIVDHDDDICRYCNDITALKVPFHISSHQTLVGWSLFKINKDISRKGDIESYLIKVIDTHDFEISIEPIIVREVMSYEEMEKKESST